MSDQQQPVEVERFFPKYEAGGGEGMREHHAGKWVRHRDYEQATTSKDMRIEELEGELEEAREALNLATFDNADLRENWQRVRGERESEQEVGSLSKEALDWAAANIPRDDEPELGDILHRLASTVGRARVTIQNHGGVVAMDEAGDDLETACVAIGDLRRYIAAQPGTTPTPSSEEKGGDGS